MDPADQPEPQPPAEHPAVPGPVLEPASARRPSTLGGAVYLLVVAACIAGLVVTAFGPWRKGVAVIGIGLLVAAAARTSLSELSSGMLRVRGKWVDVVALAGVGVVLILLANVIPNQPGG